ncbi:hypothetical protein LOY37_01950 [Pseudomonas sp. B21-012]|uniref:hypothetical protein n=1 Tax=Pseudomonas sp. B21-012 TaxID=2895472 RepID=UPI002160EE82|nr:hypothetical protein [Pseudomonas sp. B21-012]UVM56367.1 hypothetical protein LOY37_01950 [Pseudomonas sp. B21-012]
MSTIVELASAKFKYSLKHASGYFKVTVRNGVNETVYENDNVSFLRAGEASLIYCVFNDWPFDPSKTYPAVWISTRGLLELREYAIKPDPAEGEFLGLLATYSNGNVSGNNPGTGKLEITSLSNQTDLLHIEGKGDFSFTLADGRTTNVVIDMFTAQYHSPTLLF